MEFETLLTSDGYGAATRILAGFWPVVVVAEGHRFTVGPSRTPQAWTAEAMADDAVTRAVWSCWRGCGVPWHGQGIVEATTQRDAFAA